MKKIFTKTWFKASFVRALKTFAQSALALITVGNLISEQNWLSILSVSATAAVVSLLTSIGGLPEVTEDDKVQYNVYFTDKETDDEND